MTTSTPSKDNDNSSSNKDNEDANGNVEHGDGSLYDDVIQNGDDMTSIGGHFLDVEKSIPKAQAQTSNRLPSTVTETQHESEPDYVDLSKPFMVNVKTIYLSQSINIHYKSHRLFLF